MYLEPNLRCTYLKIAPLRNTLYMSTIGEFSNTVYLVFYVEKFLYAEIIGRLMLRDLHLYSCQAFEAALC